MNASELYADIQRLVDGELTHDRRARLLENLSRRPIQWRDLAIAFVERQVLDESLSNNVVTRLSSLAVNGVSQGNGRRKVERQGSDPKLANAHGRMANQLSWAAAAAACLLIGFVVGNWRVPMPRLENEAQVASAANEALDASAAATKRSAGPAAVIPLADALSRASYPISVDLRREMMRQGYLITELDRLSKVRLPTGQTVELPVRQVAVTYMGHAAYQ
jgi:hypothetical protein